MPFELFMAIRYLREGKGQTWSILTGVGVGVGVVVFLSALITGLQERLVERTLGTQAHVVVEAPEDMPRVLEPRDDALREVRIERPAQRVRSIVQWQRARDEIARMPGVVATAPTISGPALAVRGGAARSVLVRGIEPESYLRIVDLRRFLRSGSVELDGFEAVIGASLATDLGLSVGDRFRLRVSSGDDDATGVYTVAGIIEVGVEELDERWVLVALRTAQAAFDLEGGVSALEVKGTEIYEADALGAAIGARTRLDAQSWLEANAQLLAGLRSQSASSALIQTFVALAVALGIASVLAVAVVQKSREIGILRATGTSRRQVMRIFLLQGSIVGALGSAVGVLIGIGLGYFFSRLSLEPDGSPTFPVHVDALLYVRTAALALVVGLAAALLPARRAARMDPARVIRYG